ncbi:MAG: hypothetical protein L0219_08360, partial [Phycisphaerales bacterium]|nr:hypothetical protein [Phycisphaerales bacterium]
SAQATLKDFAALAWPALLLIGMAVILELALRPTSSCPRRSAFLFGFPPFLAVVGGSFWYVRLTY